MKKKTISLFLVFALCLSFSTVAFAEEDPSVPIPAKTMQGIITTDDGRVSSITGTLVNTVQTMSAGDVNASATYEYLVPSSSSVVYDDIDSEFVDPGYVSRVYLTIYYSYTIDTPSMYLLREVSGYWKLTDSHARVESATLVYGCSDFVHATQSNTTSVNNYFNIDTGFDTYIYRDIGVMGCNLTLDYVRGGSRWSATFTNNLFNN